MKHAIEFFFFSLFRGFLHILPFSLVQRTGKVLGYAAFTVLSRRRSITLENLRYAFPEKSGSELNRIARGAFGNFGIAISEFLCFSRLDSGDLRRLLNYDSNRAQFDRIRDGGGMILLSGHFGNWELTAAGTAGLAAVPVLVVVKTQSNRRVDDVIGRLRCRFGNSIVPMDRAVRELLGRLHRGGTVAMAPDQSASRESDFVEFFGRTVATFRGPAMLALRSGVPLKIGFTVRRNDYTYDFVLEDIDYDDLDGPSGENVTELTRRHVRVLERYVRRYPDQWLWMHRRWKHLAGADDNGGGQW